MKIKKPLAKILLVSTVILSCTFLAVCGTKEAQTSSPPESPIGIYTNIQGFKDVSSRLVGTHVMLAERDTVGQVSSLTVYNSAKAIQLDEKNNAVKGEDGEIIHVDNNDEKNKFYKYIFTKNAIIAGESFLVYNRGQYAGYCTYDAETGELMMYTPEYYMTYTTNKRELDNWPQTVTNIKVTDDVLANPTSGLSFSSEWQAHSNNTLPLPMNIVLKDNLQFDFISQYRSEDSRRGNNYNYDFEDYSYLYDNNGGE
jgi:hypothetical protein